MVAFLDKHFEFTTTLSMNECVERFNAKSRRGLTDSYSRGDILVSISFDPNGRDFKLDRDEGRNLYAEVQGQLRKNDNGLITVSGFGRVRFSTFLGFVLFFIASCFMLRLISPEFSWLWVFVVPAPFLFLVIIHNRNGLIREVYKALDRNE